MKNPPDFILTGRMVRDLCADSPRARLLHRLHAVALVYYGIPSRTVSEIFGDSQRSVAYWAKRFSEQGLAGLEEASRPGRPARLSEKQMLKVQRFTEKMDGKKTPVNARALADFVFTHFNVSLAGTQCWRILQRLREQKRPYLRPTVRR